jgi:hypothetical protein
MKGGRYGPSVAKLAANPGIEVRSQVREATFHPRVASIISSCSKITLMKYNSCSIRLFARVIKKFNGMQLLGIKKNTIKLLSKVLR